MKHIRRRNKDGMHMAKTGNLLLAITTNRTAQNRTSAPETGHRAAGLSIRTANDGQTENKPSARKLTAVHSTWQVQLSPNRNILLLSCSNFSPATCSVCCCASRCDNRQIRKNLQLRLHLYQFEQTIQPLTDAPPCTRRTTGHTTVLCTRTVWPQTTQQLAETSELKGTAARLQENIHSNSLPEGPAGIAARLQEDIHSNSLTEGPAGTAARLQEDIHSNSLTEGPAGTALGYRKTFTVTA
jgi:hypothetical protein